MKGEIFSTFPVGEIYPQGWLKERLETQAKGLAGNLDKMWRDVKDSKWIGGDAEGWERVPYWLDGFIPLAYLLRDEDMIKRTKKYVDAIIDGQQEDGWICPCERTERGGYDMWALFIILKALTVYADCSGDDRIEEVVYKALKNYDSFVNGKTAFNWGQSRWFECVVSINWLYKRRPEKWLHTLAEKLEAIGLNYLKAPSLLKNRATNWSYYSHVVNLGMAIKADAVMNDVDGRDPTRYAEKLVKILQKYHGSVNGYWNGDECLGGKSPVAGTELCGVVETMYSYEILSRYTTDVKWADLCELFAYNSLPATISEDMWTHQYLQMANQAYAVRQDPTQNGDGQKDNPFTTNSTESHVFGLEPNYGCCTANMGQGYPKFALNGCLKAHNGIVVCYLAPNEIRTTVGGNHVTVTTVTDYPFKDKISVKVHADKPTEFTLYIRIPALFDGAKINGEKVKTGEYFTVTKKFTDDEFVVELFAEPKFVKRGKLFAVTRGALTFTLPVKEKWVAYEYEKNGVERKFPYCDYEIYPESEWRYGFYSDDLTYGENDVDYFFKKDDTPCFIETTVAPVEWKLTKKLCYFPDPAPKSAKATGEPVKIKLVPFALSKLRMTELPKIEK
ncbi:MAG: glycoside hydrolase family 127 protein [Clostridia bacterium]|nr:glycoside hydrolase family 127 protein [Clostridia bacterium]